MVNRDGRSLFFDYRDGSTIIIHNNDIHNRKQQQQYQILNDTTPSKP